MKKLSLPLAISLLTAAAQAQDLTLEEVVVTAQKRAESLQDVPISVSAMDQSKIEDAGIKDLADLAAYVPNFAVIKDPVGDKINIRGIQSGNNAGIEQSVGTFVDGIYRGRGVQSRFAFMDVGMVEVLRGPQGTLFGKNTIAGALNITSAKPTDDFFAEVTGGYTPAFGQTEAKAVMSGALSDRLRARLALQDNRMDAGWMENSHYDKDVPVSTDTAGRLSIEWDASDATLVTAKIEHGEFDTQGMPWDTLVPGALANFGVEGGANYQTDMGNTPGHIPAFASFGAGNFANDPNGVMDFGANNTLKGDTTEALLSVQHSLAGGQTLTAIAGHSEYQYDRWLDADFGPLSAVRFDDSEDYDQNSVELRIASETGSRFEYIAGAYYQTASLKADGLSYFNAGTLVPLLKGGCASALGAAFPLLYQYGSGAGTAQNVANAVGAAGGQGAALANACGQAAAFEPVADAGINGGGRYLMLDQDSESWALFAQGTFNLRDDLRATLGLRYTEETKEGRHVGYATDFVENSKVASTNPYVIAMAQAIGEFVIHDYDKNDPGMTRDESGLTWSANLQYDLSADTLVYVSASTGFKAGGFNSFYTGVGPVEEDASFDEEDVITYEIGSKMTLANGAAELNAALFYTQFDDLQAAIFTGGTTFVVQNAAQANTRGFELDGRWRVSQGLTLLGSLGYVDFEYDSFPNQACTAAQFAEARQAAYEASLGTALAGIPALTYSNASCSADGINDLAGQTADNAPEWKAAFGANYVKAFGAYELTANLDLNWSDEVYRSADLDPNALQDAYTKINGALVFGPADGQWDIALIGKNLTDEKVISYVNDTPLFNGTFQYMIEAPQSYTLRGRYRF